MEVVKTDHKPLDKPTSTSDRQLEHSTQPQHERLSHASTNLMRRRGEDDLPAEHRPSPEITVEPCGPHSAEGGLHHMNRLIESELDMLVYLTHKPHACKIQPWSCFPRPPRKRLQINDLPGELRNMIYANLTAGFIENVRPVRRKTGFEKSKLFSSFFERTGLPALAIIFPELKADISSLLRGLYEKCTFQFNFDDRIMGLQDFRFWVQSCRHEALAVQRISIEYMSHASDTWTPVSLMYSRNVMGSIQCRSSICPDEDSGPSANCQRCRNWYSTNSLFRGEEGVSSSLIFAGVKKTLRDEDRSLVQVVEDSWAGGHRGICQSCEVDEVR